MALPTLVNRATSGKALSSQLNATGLASTYTTGQTFTVLDASTWIDIATGNPLGQDGSPFTVAVDYGGSAEEKILCSGISGNVITIWTDGTLNGRGYDGSSATLHSANAIAVPVWTATEADEANRAVQNTIGRVTTVGDMLYATSSSAIGRLGIGASGSILVAGSGAPTWLAPGSTGTLLQGGTTPSWLALGAASTMLTSTGTGLAWAKLAPDHLECYNTGSGQNISQTSGTITTTVTLGSSVNSQGANPPTLASNVVTVHEDGLYQINFTVEMANTSNAVVAQPAVTVNTQQYHGSSILNNAAANTAGTVAVTVPMTSGQTITPQVISTAISSFTWQVAATQKATNLTVTRLGPLV
jgi:hypothetical protein